PWAPAGQADECGERDESLESRSLVGRLTAVRWVASTSEESAHAVDDLGELLGAFLRVRLEFLASGLVLPPSGPRHEDGQQLSKVELGDHKGLQRSDLRIVGRGARTFDFSGDLGGKFVGRT